MKSKRKIIFSDSAVSPVIGVMLMIVVTVILAAAVSSFTGSIGEKEDPTQAIFDVECSLTDGIMTIKHMGGDPIYKEDVKIMISHGLPKLTGYLSNENLTFYPADQQIRNPAMDKISLQAGQTAIYEFDNNWTYDGNSSATSNTPERGARLDEQVIMVGETFEFSLVDVNTENAIFTTNVIMEP